MIGYGRLLNQLHPNLTPDWILPGNGSAELLTWAGRELAQLDETSIVTPAFSDYRRALKAFDAKVREFPLLNSDGVWLDNLLPESLSVDGCTEELSGRTEELSGFTAVRPYSRGLLLNNPHNPTGILFDVEAILPLLERFALVVVDEAFMDFLPPQQQQSLISVVQDYDNLVILRSLTKFYSLPGLRLGYCIAHPKRLQRWQQWRDPWVGKFLGRSRSNCCCPGYRISTHDLELVKRSTDAFIPGFRSVTRVATEDECR